MKREAIFMFLFLVIGCTTQAPEGEEIPGITEKTPVVDVVEEPKENVSKQSAKPIAEETVPEPVAKDLEEDTFEKPKCIREFFPKFNAGSYYEGILFDAHFHMPNLISLEEIPEGHSDQQQRDHDSSITDPVLGKDTELDKILCNFDKENVVGVIGFVIGAEEVLDKTLTRSIDINEKSSGKINLFLMPAGFSTDSLDDIQQNNPSLFKGYGEMAFYHPSYANTPPDSPTIMGIYKVAEKHNLIVMMHPAGRQKTQVENAIRQNPNVKFLIHGPEAESYITNLMSKYPNVYYSIDAVLARIPPAPAALMYMVSSKEEFLSKFPQNFDLMLNDAEKNWKSKIEKYPDRFMWGTDRGDLWTYDEDVGIILEEFARAFIASLDPSVQEKFAYKNAEKLLQ